MGMSVAEYELQKATGRFRILTIEEAVTVNTPGAEEYAGWREDWRSLLVEFVDDKPVRILASDGGCPEDQLLTRDWQWVAVELNALAEARAIGELEAQINQKMYAIVAYEQVAEMLENIGPEFSQEGDAAALSAARRFCKSLAQGARGIVAKIRAERDALLSARAATGEPKEAT